MLTFLIALHSLNYILSDSNRSDRYYVFGFFFPAAAAAAFFSGSFHFLLSTSWHDCWCFDSGTYFRQWITKCMRLFFLFFYPFYLFYLQLLITIVKFGFGWFTINSSNSGGNGGHSSSAGFVLSNVKFIKTTKKKLFIWTFDHNFTANHHYCLLTFALVFLFLSISILINA